MRLAGKADADCLYILGDIVDRGPQVAELLEDIMGRKNVRLLAGNQEYIGLRVLGMLCKKEGLWPPYRPPSSGAYK